MLLISYLILCCVCTFQSWATTCFKFIDGEAIPCQSKPKHGYANKEGQKPKGKKSKNSVDFSKRDMLLR